MKDFYILFITFYKLKILRTVEKLFLCGFIYIDKMNEFVKLL